MNEILTLLAEQIQLSFNIAVIAIAFYVYIWIVTELESRKI
jgi:hypothetical protein